MTKTFRLPKQPVIYEINTAVFLSGLSKKYDRVIHLGSVPEEEWQKIARLPVDAVWLMGVWERSPHSRKDSMHNVEFKRALPDFDQADNLGSAYSIKTYDVDKHFGGNDGLAKARAALRDLGVGLILDYVPNHIACDHEWVEKHPEYLIKGSVDELKRFPDEYYRSPHGIFARGRDPEFPAWSDVLQLNAFSSGLREAAAKTLAKIAGQCDGVRCDMAMLMMSRNFAITWIQSKGRGEITDREYWQEVIPKVREEHRNFVFIAETYWNTERSLLEMGFDYCYDKMLYDYLAEGTSLQLFHHIHASADYQSHMLRFIENHDEPRAARVFKSHKYEAAAFVLATLPGATMYHEGQLEGYKTKLPVHLARAPIEKTDQDIRNMYAHLMYAVSSSHMREGKWQLCRGNNGFFRTTKLLAWAWVIGSDRFLCIANYNPDAAAGHFALPPLTTSTATVLLGGSKLTDRGYRVQDNWISLELQSWGYALLQFEPRR